MATRPTDSLPGWTVTDAAQRVEPNGSKKNQGWIANEPLPAKIANWLFYSISTWLDYLVDLAENELLAKPGLLARGFVNISGTYTISSTDNGKILKVDSTSGSFNIQLPSPSLSSGLKFTVKDVGGVFNQYPVTLIRFGAEQIEQITANYELAANFGSWVIYCDGSHWTIL